MIFPQGESLWHVLHAYDISVTGYDIDLRLNELDLALLEPDVILSIQTSTR